MSCSRRERWTCASQSLSLGCRYTLILKTTDAGESWYVKLSIPFTYFSGICFSNDSTVWAIGTDTGPFEIYKSVDKGENWIPIIVGVQDKKDIYFFNEQIGYFTALNQLYRTTDGGLSFQIDPSVSDFGSGRFENFLFQSIFIIGNRVFVTTNGGEEWLDYPEVQGQGLKALSLYEVNKGYAVGNTGIILKYFDESIPVELTDFSGVVKGREVLLTWKTVSEKNNLGFEIQRKAMNISDNSKWEGIDLVQGNGTTTLPHSYSYSDRNISPGEYKYRLKQIDFDGSFEYSKEVEINIDTPNKFTLEQNYPNPFNPTTRISFSLPTDSKVTLSLFDILGREIKTLLNKDLQAGYYNIDFNASGYPSGVYFYRLRAERINGENFSSTKKMLLLR